MRRNTENTRGQTTSSVVAHLLPTDAEQALNKTKPSLLPWKAFYCTVVVPLSTIKPLVDSLGSLEQGREKAMAPATTTAEMGEAPGSETLKDATIDVRMATGNHNTTQLWRTWDEKVRVQDRSVHVSANSRQKGDLRSRQRVTRERERERERVHRVTAFVCTRSLERTLI